MPEVTLYHYPRCSTSRKARQLLDQLGVNVQERRYFTELPTEAEIRALARLLPGGVHDIISTRSRRYRRDEPGRRAAQRGRVDSPAGHRAGIVAPSIVVKGRQAVVGYDEERLRALAE